MKKIFTLILFAAGVSFTASAQNGNDRYNNQDRYPVNQSGDNWNNGNQQQSRDYGYNDRGYNDRRCNERRQRNDDYRRQQEYDRMNQECDQKVEVYRNDRSMNNYEKNRRIQDVEYERQQRSKSFGKGLVVGGIAAILLGVLLSHGQ